MEEIAQLQKNQRKTHVALFTSPGMGHLIPSCEFARRLSLDFGCKVTFILYSSFNSSAQASSYIRSLADPALQIDFVYLPEIKFEDENAVLPVKINFILKNSVAPLQEILSSFKSSPSPISAFVTDFLCARLIKDIAEIQIPTYILFTCSAAFLRFMFRQLESGNPFPLPPMPGMMQMPPPPSISGADMPPPPSISGADMPPPPSMPGAGMPPPPSMPGMPGMDQLQVPGMPLPEGSGPNFTPLMDEARLIKSATGILINTFAELEGSALKELSEMGKNTDLPRIHPVGPLIPSAKDQESACLKWLDDQPPSSVVFISFGSGATVSVEQISEIAQGLEKSGQRFLWVVRKPLSNNADSTYFKIPETIVEDLLPQGFLERTKDRGLVLPSWAPQTAVLAHPSTGGFVCHCGWNSILESVYFGVPMVAWPMFADQFLNAETVTKEYGLAVELQKEKDGSVKKEEVERAVCELMQGETGLKVRERYRHLREKGRLALQPGGSSWEDLASVVEKWKSA
eukprot:TRINITY_DN4039_c0_g1_i1.p1 TRINITY_DN4039_c0_g1~~TRINITY_DN4039_c0_g1_i1.p1  ORF type:complete len:514 (-),score=28.56 TRINITY_DN4039_c0_g1_i1:95-1636(-)